MLCNNVTEWNVPTDVVNVILRAYSTTSKTILQNCHTVTLACHCSSQCTDLRGIRVKDIAYAFAGIGPYSEKYNTYIQWFRQ